MASVIYTAGEPIADTNTNVRGYNADTGATGITIAHARNIYGLAVNGLGNILVGDDGGAGNGMRRYTSSGSLVWSKTHFGQPIWAAAGDAAGNVYFAGGKTTDPITTRKYNSAGTAQWAANHGASVYGIAVDTSGNVYTGGAVSSSVTTRKYNSSGTLQWSANHAALVRGIAVDSSGNVYTCGVSDGSNTVRKYNSSGSLQWSANTGSNDYGIALDSDGNCYVCGYEYVKKFNSSGTEITTGGFPITVTYMTLRGIALDKSGNIFVCGPEYNSKTLIKFNSSGVEQWSKNHGTGYNIFCLALYEPVEVPGLSVGVALGAPVSVVATVAPALALPLALAIPTPSSPPEPLDIRTLTAETALIYRCYVGSATGALLEYPFRALQCRRRRNDSTWLNVELPGVTPTQAATLLNCVDHALVIYVGTRQKDVETLGEFLYAVLTSVEYEQAPFRSVARLTGRVAAVNETLQTRALLGVTSVQNEDGRERVRCACIDYRLRPGDTVTVGTTSFVAYRVAYQIAPAQQWMEVEAEPL